MTAGSILVVDDEYGVRSGIRTILEMEGYDVDEAGDGAEALAQLEQRDFDVALLDYRLPDTDGLSLLQTMKAGGCEAMVCMITAYANIDTAVAATRQGVDFFLPKPFTPDDLIGVVETLLRHRQARDDVSPHAPPAPERQARPLRHKEPSHKSPAAVATGSPGGVPGDP